MSFRKRPHARNCSTIFVALASILTLWFYNEQHYVSPNASGSDPNGGHAKKASDASAGNEASHIVECRITRGYVVCEGDVGAGFRNKKRGMQAMLNTSLRTLKELNLSVPNCVLRVNLASGGSFNPQDLCIARSEKTMRCTMVPNPYFGDLYDWESKQVSLMKQNVPWDRKLDKVFYRGRCDRHSQARFNLVDMHDDRLDVGWIQNSLTASCLSSYTNDSTKMAFHMGKSTRPLPEEHFSNFKFLVRLPGSTGASYSRHLNYLWNKGSIVLLWESEAEEWYYNRLKDSVTHLVVNESNIVLTIEHVLRLPTELQLQLVAEAHGVFHRVLTRRALALEWYKIMLLRATNSKGDED